MGNDRSIQKTDLRFGVVRHSASDIFLQVRRSTQTLRLQAAKTFDVGPTRTELGGIQVRLINVSL